MQYREFGSTGLKMSALGLGCMRMPTKPFRFQKMDVKRSIHLIRSAVDMGINYIDTAWFYHLGESEKVLGMALQEGYREKVHLVTKLPMFLVRRESDFESYLEKQLYKLQTGCIDTYLFHAMNASALEKVKKFNFIDKMKKARDEGKIKYIGFSFHDSLPVFREIIDYYDWDVVQIQYNYMDTNTQAGEEGLKYAASKGMAVVVMEPLRGGQLANPPKEALEVINKASVKRTPVDWALQYLWDKPEVSVVLSGMGNMKMLAENIESAEKSGIGMLRAEEVETIGELTRIYAGKTVVPCTACQYCMPCPAGVHIPGNFAAVNNKALGSGVLMGLANRRNYRRLVKDRKKLNSAKTNGHAVLCTECGKCLEHCPQSINIPEELKKVAPIMKGKMNIS